MANANSRLDTLGAPHSAQLGFSEAYKRWALGLLLIIYTTNYIDRTIINILGQAIKVDLKISDTQLGLLGGIAFAIFYALCGLPIARLAERMHRINIISICLVLWSGMTALCGIAQSFWQLLAYRIGVGVGEAGCTPPAHSLITDYYPPNKRATAIAVYSFGIPLGTLIGAIFGGYVAQNFDWRHAFILVGLPGIALALLARLSLREPPRGLADDPAAVAAALKRRPPSLRDATRILFSKPSFRHLVTGFTLTGFASYGLNQFTPPYFIRMFDLGLSQAGLLVGLVVGGAMGVGMLAGGALSDWAATRDRRWYVWVPAIGVLVAAPVYAIGYTQASWTAAAVLLLLPGVFHYTHLGPVYAAIHNMVEPRMRATAIAIVLIILGLIGLGLGPVFTGMAIDLFSQHAFQAQGLGDFATLCPGGVAVDAANATACKTSLATATRNGILATTLVLVWAGIHYLLAARRLREDMAAATAALSR